MKSKSDTNLFSLALPVGAPSTEWEGMTYVAIRGSHDSLNQLGIGKKENDFADAYVSLHNKRTGKHCGAIVKKLEYHETSALETDLCLLSDLSAEIGSSLEISALSPVPASQVHLLASSTELATRELQNLCATYLARQSLCAGQRKSIHLFSGEKFDIEITDVKPLPMCIYTSTTELVIDKAPDFISTGGLDAIGGLAKIKGSVTNANRNNLSPTPSLLLWMSHFVTLSGQLLIHAPRFTRWYGRSPTLLRRQLQQSDFVSQKARPNG